MREQALQEDHSDTEPGHGLAQLRDSTSFRWLHCFKIKTALNTSELQIKSKKQEFLIIICFIYYSWCFVADVVMSDKGEGGLPDIDGIYSRHR